MVSWEKTPHPSVKVWQSFKKKCLTLEGRELIPEHTAQSLGVILDTSLTYEEYIPKTASSWVSSLSQIRQKKHTFDKCPLLTTFKHNVSKLQSMLNFVAQIVSKICKYDHTRAVLKELWWHPVATQLDFRNAVVAITCLTSGVPALLSSQLITWGGISRCTTRVYRCSTFCLLRLPVVKALFIISPTGFLATEDQKPKEAP